jgi:hypothetical protein
MGAKSAPKRAITVNTTIVLAFPNNTQSRLHQRNEKCRRVVSGLVDRLGASRRKLARRFGIPWPVLDRWLASGLDLPHSTVARVEAWRVTAQRATAELVDPFRYGAR